MSRSLLATALASALALPLAAPFVHAAPVREELRVVSGDDLELAVRRVVDDAAPRTAGPLLLVHGARVGSVPSFDVDVEGYSLVEDLARAGHTVYLADVRGFGRSDYPHSMTGDRFGQAPAVPTSEAVEDLAAVLETLRARHLGEPIAALGWATGSHWLAATAAAHPDAIDRLVVYNGVYGGEGDWPLTDTFSADGEPGTFDLERFGAWRLSDAESLVGRWTEADAVSDAFVARYVGLAMAGDPTATERDPVAFRHPSGPIADTLSAVHEGPLYDASQIEADVLILRSGDDFWSRPVDVETMRADLSSAASVAVHEMPGASHYVHLEPGEGRDRFVELVLDFAADGALDESEAS